MHPLNPRALIGIAAVLGILAVAGLLAALPWWASLAFAQDSPSAAVELSAGSVAPGTEITATMSFSNLETDSDTATTDYIFRADVLDDEDGDAGGCEGGGMDRDRYFYKVDEDPETRVGTVSADCPAGDYTVRVTLSSADNTELDSDSANFTVAEPAPEPTPTPEPTPGPTPEPPPSDDATLRSLELSGVALEFDPATTGYAASVANRVAETAVTATVNDDGATYKVKLGGVAQGDGVVPLAVGQNAITVEVAAEDGETTRTYTVAVTRAGPPSVTITLSPANSVEEGEMITATMSFGDLEADSDTSTVDYIFRADVLDGEGNDADSCEGGGMGRDRNFNKVDEDPETRTGSTSTGCPAGVYTLRASVSSAGNTELASASAGFGVLEEPTIVVVPPPGEPGSSRQGNEGTELWSATLTVGSNSLATSAFGWEVSGFYTDGALTDEEFDYAGNTYAFISIYTDTTQDILAIFLESGKKGDAAGRNAMRLHVGTGADEEVFYLREASHTTTSNGNHSATWSEAGLTWADGDTVALRMTQHTVPGAPTLTATVNGKTQIDLSWEAPENDGGPDITDYKLEVCETGCAAAAATWTVLDADPGTESTATTYSHTGLTAETTRSYRVSAKNSLGFGAPSEVVSATTAGDALVSNIGQEAGNAVPGVLSSNEWFMPFTTGSNAGDYNLSSIELSIASVAAGFTSSDFTMAIWSATAANPPLPHAQAHPLSNPSPFTAGTRAFSASSVVLEASTTYFVHVSNSGSVEVKLSRTNSHAEDAGAAQGWSIGDLRYFRTRGTTASFRDSTQPIQFAVQGSLKQATVPDPPALTATVNGKTQIDLSWTAPQNDGGPDITDYKLEVCATNCDAAAATWTVLDADPGTESTATTYSHTGLTAETTRSYRVSAKNSLGFGAPSEVVSATTAGDAVALVSNILQAGEASHYYSITHGRAAAQGFTTGPNPAGYDLASVVVDLYQASGVVGSLTATIRADDSGNPSSTVFAALTSPTTSSAGLNTFTAPSGTVLAARTTYFVHLVDTAAGLNPRPKTVQGDGEDAGGAPGWSIHDHRNHFENSAWDTGTFSLRIRVQGSLRTTVPDPPALTAAANAETRIDLSWEAPENDGGLDITDYRLEVCATGCDAASATWTVLDADPGTESTATTYSHTGLTAETTRSYRVSAKNSLGFGAPSEVVSATTFDALVANTGQSRGYPWKFNSLDAREIGQSFTTGGKGGGYTLTGLKLLLGAAPGTPGSFTVQIRADSSGNPGDAALVEFTNPAAFTANGLNTFTPTAEATLAKDTTYFVYVAYSETTGTIPQGWTSGSHAEDSGAAAGWSIADGYRLLTNNVWGGGSGLVFMVALVGSAASGTNSAPVFADTTATRSVAENTAAGQDVGAVVTATDADGDTLTYTLEGTGAASFAIVSTSGQIQTKAALDYETKSSYSVMVKASDVDGASDTIAVTINVSNADDPGTVTFFPAQPRVGTPVTATLSDQDGGVRNVIWLAWSSSTDKSTWTVIILVPNASASYTPVDGDLNKYLRVTVEYRDVHGQSQRVALGTTENPVAAAANNPATGKPAITGTAQVGRTLTAGKGTIADADGVPAESTFTYQWIRVASDNTESDIATNGTSKTYRAVTADQGKTLKVRVSFTDDAGNAESRTSDAKGPLAAVTCTPEPPADAIWSACLIVGTSEGSGLSLVGFNAGTYGDLSDTGFTTAGGGSYTLDQIYLTPHATNRILLVSFTADPGDAVASWAFGSGSNSHSFTDASQTADGFHWTGTSLSWSDGDVVSVWITDSSVSNADEPGTVTLSPAQPRVGTPVTATLSDPDGGVSNVNWLAWRTSADKSTWTPISGSRNSASYTPVDGDLNKYVRVTASYADALGAKKAAEGTTENPVAAAGAAPAVSLALSPDSIGEKGGTSTVTATVSPASETPFTVTVATVPATPSDDFKVTPNRTVSFAADATSSTGIVTITAVNNDVDAADRTVTVSGTASINTVTAPSDLTLTITDDDVPAFTIEDASGSEGGMVVFRVRMSVASTKAMTVNYATSDIAGQAVAGTDYTASNGTLTFAIGDTLQTIGVTTTDDTVDDPVETFTMTLSSPSADATGDAAVLATASATGTISEGATLSIADASISEGAKMHFTVTLSEAPTGSDRVTVRYATSTEADDTAEMTYDYTRKRGILSFTSANTETGFLVPTVNDGVDEEDETFTVTLSNPSSGVTITTATAKGTITDDDEVPGAPANLAAEAGDAQVVLTWAAPDSAGTSAITVYQYSYAPSGEAFSAWDSAGLALTATVTGLTNGDAHEFLVRAVSAAGAGPAASQAATPQAAVRTNNAPVFADATATRSVAENTAADTNISYPVTATDADGDTLTYTLEGTDAASFAIVSTNGRLRTKAALDYETKSSYSVTVRASDGTDSDTIDVSIRVIDVAEGGTVDANHHSAPGQTIWSARMTSRPLWDDGDYFRVFRYKKEGSDGNQDQGALSDDDFVFDSTTYTVREIRQWRESSPAYAEDWLTVVLSRELEPADLGKLTLHVSGVSFAFSKAEDAPAVGGEGRVYSWKVDWDGRLDWRTGSSLRFQNGLVHDVHITSSKAVTNTMATGRPVITGEAKIGETLRVDTSGIADANGLSRAVFKYQWTVIEANGAASDRLFMDENTVRLSSWSKYMYGHLGKKLQVRVFFTDDSGNVESLLSGTTDTIVDQE